MNDILEQLPNESSRAYTAFVVFAGLGSQRTLQDAAARSAKSIDAMKRWSTKYDWFARARHYDAYLASIEHQFKVAALRENAADWAKRQDAFREKEWNSIDQLLDKVGVILQDQELEYTFRDAATALALASRVGRIACGLPTKGIDANTDAAPMPTIDIQAALEAVYGRDSDKTDSENTTEQDRPAPSDTLPRIPLSTDAAEQSEERSSSSFSASGEVGVN
jgi:hypothetical protein